MTNTPDEYSNDSLFSNSALAFIANHERDGEIKPQGLMDKHEQEMNDVWDALDLLVNDDFCVALNGFK